MQYFKKGLRSIGQMMTTILLNSYVLSAILISPFLLMGSPRIMAAVIVPDLIQIIDTSLFTPSSPDPAGIVYFPSTKGEVRDFFLITDSEVNEMLIFEGVNVFKTDRSGNLLDTFATIRCTDAGPCVYGNPLYPPLPGSFSDEPTGITFNPNNNHCFISDDNDPRSIHEVDPGSDGICLTDDDIVTSFNLKTSFNIDDPEDVTFGLNSLFIIDGLNEEVYRIQRDAEGLFNQLHSFDTDILGMHDPEGIVFDASNDSLYIVGRLRGLIIHTTTYGVLLDILNLNSTFPDRIEFPNRDDRPLKPAGLALAPTSIYPSRSSLYLVDRGIDNDKDPYENDGRIYELMLPATTPGNLKPMPEAGIDQSIKLPDNAQLDGIVDNEVLSSLISTWSKLNGPGEVSFTDPNNLSTSASFTMSGIYVLRLTVYDGELYNFDDIEIKVESDPVLTLIGKNPLNLTLGNTFTDPGATAIDDTDGVLTDIKVTGTVNTAVAAIYTITYKVTDSAGNTVSATRSVIVRDNTIAPAITLFGENPMQINLNEIFTDPGATATDDTDGVLTDDIIVTGTVDTTVAETYQVTYTVIDSDGNTATVNRSVIVSSETDSQKNDVTASTSSGGGGTNETLLLLLTLIFLFRHHRRGKWL